MTVTKIAVGRGVIAVAILKETRNLMMTTNPLIGCPYLNHQNPPPMKQVGNILLVEVKEDSKYFDLTHLLSDLEYWDKNNNRTVVKLPPGDWQLLRSCTADRLEEKDLPGFFISYDSTEVDMDLKPIGEKESFFWYEKVRYNSFQGALAAFVRSQGYEPSKTVILLKQQSNNP
jgi:hypothetical protein